MEIFLLTGEPSGDLHGARLAEALRARQPRAIIRGVGGYHMRAAGVELVARSDGWGAMGLAEALGKVPRLLMEKARLVRDLRANPPDVLVPIDFGAFNVRVLRALRGSGIRAVYYIPPGCWSRTRPAGDVPWLVEAIATPFPWSADRLRTAGAPARVEWVGHPILDYCRPTITRDAARAALGVTPERPVVAILPGSRPKELRHLLPVFLEAARRLTPRPLCLLAAAPRLEAAIRRRVPDDMEIHLMHGVEYDVARAADAALVASGTATLEMACLDVPMVVAYRGSWFDALQWRVIARGGRIRFIALPNILADAPVVPELLGDAATPRALADALTPLLVDTTARRAQCAAFATVRASLGHGDAVARTAALVLDIAEK